MTGIAQKSCATLFPLWSLRKNDISKNKNNICKEGTQKSLKGLLKIKCRKKNKSKKYTYPDYAVTPKFSLLA